MGKKTQEVTMENSVFVGKESQNFNHPAFGLIKRNVYSGATTVFGSPVQSDELISITVTSAEHIHTNSSDTYNPLSTELSVIVNKSQWADLISTSNSGVGTPCTIQYRRTGDLENVPEIANPRYFSKDYNERVKQSAKAATERLVSLNKNLIEEINGKASKVRLKEIQRLIDIELKNLPANLAFTVDIAEESMTEIANEIAVNAKSKIESYAESKGVNSNIKQIDLK